MSLFHSEMPTHSPARTMHTMHTLPALHALHAHTLNLCHIDTFCLEKLV